MKRESVFVWLAITMLVVFLQVIAAVPISISDLMYKTDQGIICNKCPPGMMVLEDCLVDFENATCVPCPAHHFMEGFNGERHCTPCKSSCPKNGHVVQNCSTTTNLVCRCDPGHHRYPVDIIDKHFKCREHTPCRPGEGEKFYGNHSHDTECEKCVEGEEFLNTSDPGHPVCQTCSECAPGSVVLVNCSLEQDTVCSRNSTTEDGITTSEPVTGSEGLDGGMIALIVIIILIVIIGIVIGLVIFYRRRRRRQGSRSPKKEKTTNGNAETYSLIHQKWTEAFIERKVCPFLSNHLGEEWRRFILQLPAWPTSVSVQTIIDHKMEEEGTVPNRILGCLKEWMRQAEPREDVSKESIVSTLIAVEKAELVETLEKEMEKYLSVSEENGQ